MGRFHGENSIQKPTRERTLRPDKLHAAKGRKAVRTRVGAANVSDTIRNGKYSYYVKMDDVDWEIGRSNST